MDPEELEIERGWFFLARLNPRKFAFFYDKYYNKVNRYIYKRVFDPDIADDLTSETFIKAQRNLWRFRWKNIPLGPWIMRIAVNEVNGHFRREGLTRDVLQMAANQDQSRPNAPLAQLILDEENQFLYRQVLDLDELSRNIFQLFYWGDCTTKEVAKILGTPEGTVKTRLNRGRIVIAKALLRNRPEISRTFEHRIPQEPMKQYGNNEVMGGEGDD